MNRLKELTGWAMIACVCVLPLSGGCARTARVSDEAVTVIRVPFFAQEDFQCGPAALATVIDYWHAKTGTGRILTPEKIAAEIYSASARGVLGIDMERYARKEGFHAEHAPGSVDKLKESIDAGIPSIVLVDYGMLTYQRNHFMVVKGYSSDGVLVNSGREESKFIGNEELLSVWKKTAYWMLLVKP